MRRRVAPRDGGGQPPKRRSPRGAPGGTSPPGARVGITVNAVCPGYIGTEMVRAIDEKVLNEKIIPQIPVGRLGEPEEIARRIP